MSRMITTVLLALILTLILPGNSRAAVARGDMDVESYVLEYTLSLDGEYVFQNSLAGSATIRFRNIGSTNIDTVPLLLNRLMRYERVTDGHGRELGIDDRLLELENYPYYQANAANVSLAEPLEAGATTELHIRFGGRLTGYADAGMLYTRENLDPAFTILRGEVLPWPRIAGPDWLEVRKDWSDTYEWRAGFDVPATHVVANGEPVQVETHGDRKIYRYHSTRPDTLLAFPIAPYKELVVNSNRILYLQGSETGARRLAEKMTQAIKLFEKWFGPNKYVQGLALIEIPEGFGSQASFPTIIQTADAFDSTAHMDQLYHELSHLWNVETYDPQSPRLEEGLATFLQGLVNVELGGSPGLEEFMQGILDRQKSTYERHPEYREIAIADFGREGVTDLSYRVGALFYYDLFQALGEERFIDLLSGYYNAFKETGGDFNTLRNYYLQHLDGNAAQLVEGWLAGTAYVDRIMNG
jgi:aminopeptidase N